jgi:hypothetical protein
MPRGDVEVGDLLERVKISLINPDNIKRCPKEVAIRHQDNRSC